MTLNGRSLKFVDKFACLGTSVSSTENDINTWLTKAWIAIDRLSFIWKSDLSDKIKRSFFSKQRPCQYCCMDAPYGGWLSVWREILMVNARKCRKLNWTSSGGSIPQSSICTDTYYPTRKPSKLYEQDTKDTAGEVGRAHKRCTSVDPFTRARVGRPGNTYLQQLCTDTGCSMKDLPKAMDDRDEERRGPGKSVPAVR